VQCSDLVDLKHIVEVPHIIKAFPLHNKVGYGYEACLGWEIDLKFTIDCHTDMNLYELVSYFLETISKERAMPNKFERQ